MTNSTTSIGFYCPGDGTSGPWRYLHSILNHLDRSVFDVTIFADLPPSSPLRKIFRVVDLGASRPHPEVPSNATPQIPAGNRKGYFFRITSPLRLWAGFLGESLRLARLFRQHPVDILHTQNTGCEESPVAARFAGIKNVVGTFHVAPSVDVQQSRAGIRYRILELISNRCLDLAFAVSADTKKQWIRRSNIPGKKVVVIHNGVAADPNRTKTGRLSARRKLGIHDSAMVIGALGRLDPVKGYSVLLDAVALLIPKHPGLKVVFAGTGPEHEALVRKASSLGLSDAALFVGFQSDVQLFLDAIDIFAMPSLSETLGYALIEAMAAGVPAVASSVGGIPEVIPDERTGFLVPREDFNMLASRLDSLISDPQLRERMGRAGQERVLNCFSEQEMVHRTIKAYDAFRSGSL